MENTRGKIITYSIVKWVLCDKIKYFALPDNDLTKSEHVAVFFLTEGITMCLLNLRKNKITLYFKHN